MLADTVFFSFAEITDPARHRDYNEWHQLDHRPENLALEGVRHGERWVRTPGCARSSHVTDERLAGTHYVNMYWFRSPWATAFAEWQGLAERSYQWGRRPEIEYTSRPLMGLFSTVRGYAARRVLVAPDALPFRPTRAVRLSLYRFDQAHSAATHAHLVEADSHRIPALLEVPGVAGAWTFSSISTTLDPSWDAVPASATFDPSGRDRGLFRAELLFIDGDPAATARALATPADTLAGAAGQEIFRSLLLPIQPWEWDWFDAQTGDVVGSGD
ncbi:MAG: hypothetical protein QOE97_3009 [Pseudonocardiales bacterium]|nr:hypothetical protein [Pseudonocardiales bacterium]